MLFNGLRWGSHPLLTPDPNLAARLQIELGRPGQIHQLAPDYGAAARTLLDPSLLRAGRPQPQPPSPAEAEMIVRNAQARPSRQQGRYGVQRQGTPQNQPAENSAPRTIDGIVSARTYGVGMKSGVRISDLDPSMEPVIGAVVQATRNLGLPQPVITAGRDGRHSPNSLHYGGLALDFRGNNISIADGTRLEAEVRRLLGAGYDVGYETFRNAPARNHLHVEHDPR